MKNKNALIIGIRDEQSICYTIAREIKRSGYNLYATYQDESTYESVKRIADDLGIVKLFQYDVRKDEELESFTQAVKDQGMELDLLVHGISYSTASGAKTNQPLTSVTWEGFTDAIRVGAFSLVEVSGKLIDVMKEGSSILTITLRWSTNAVPNFNVVCATKACLESIIRGLAQSMGKTKKIKVNGISPGFMSTFSLSKVGNSLEILEREKNKSPLKTNVKKEDVARLALSIMENDSITGSVYSIDTGVQIMGD